MISQETKTPDPKKIIIATSGALVIATFITFAFILPAELGKDPLGSGRLLGLTALSNPLNPFEAQPEGWRNDRVEFVLEPFQSVEYKYHLDLDAPMVFNWQTDGEVYYDMHAEPAGLGEEYVQSFEQGNGLTMNGAFHAPFPGIHGWFWENRGLTTVTVKLNASGFFFASTVFRDGGDFERQISPNAR